MDEERKRRRRTSSKMKRGRDQKYNAVSLNNETVVLMGQDNCFFPVDNENEKEEEKEVEEENGEEKITAAVQSAPDVELWPGLHQGDQMETGDVTEEKLGCLQEGNDEEVSCSGACMGESPPDPLGETTVLDHGREQELLVKEALHIHMTPSKESFNQNGGLEVPGLWITVMRRQGGRSNPH